MRVRNINLDPLMSSGTYLIEMINTSKKQTGLVPKYVTSDLLSCSPAQTLSALREVKGVE